ncbi:hypothetical protein T01_288 [Trichinella spiralis]|uniref:Uncharacterized protein n=1 Tax=Trichinella spiralis TaxID=6334 RepID=A0A0V0YTZ0_TRISP|nr:hypothetical protein T01_288 [Trichinella spiralis]
MSIINFPYSTSPHRIFSNMPILTSLDQRTELTNERN